VKDAAAGIAFSVSLPKTRSTTFSHALQARVERQLDGGYATGAQAPLESVAVGEEVRHQRSAST